MLSQVITIKSKCVRVASVWERWAGRDGAGQDHSDNVPPGAPCSDPRLRHCLYDTAHSNLSPRLTTFLGKSPL